jgi:hypothetical protein
MHNVGRSLTWLSHSYIWFLLQELEDDIINSTHIQIKTRKVQISEFFAIAAMILLLIHIADGSMERFSKHGFLPANINKKPFRISNFGISSIILFFLAFGIDMRGKNKSKLTTTLLIVGGALIGVTALGVAVMDKTATLLTVIVIGYVIMGLGIVRAIQLRTKPLIIIATATVAVVIVSAAAMMLGIQFRTSHNVLAQSAKSNSTTTAANTVVTVTPRQSTNKTFWISTVHLDGATTTFFV